MEKSEQHIYSKVINQGAKAPDSGLRITVSDKIPVPENRLLGVELMVWTIQGSQTLNFETDLGTLENLGEELLDASRQVRRLRTKERGEVIK